MRLILIILAATLASPLAAQTEPKPVVPGDKVRCKSHVETGSLAKMIRECHKAAEWQRMAEQERGAADYYRQSASSSRAGN